MRIAPNWFKRVIVRLAKAYDPRYTSAMIQSYMAGGKPPPFDLTNNISAIKLSLWAYVCIKKIAENIAGLPLKFYLGYGDNKKEVVSHPIADMIHRPNPFCTHRDLWIATTWSLLGAGSAYWALDQLSMDEKPVKGKTQIWLLPSDKMRVIPDESKVDNKFIKGYALKIDNRQDRKYTPGEIVHFKSFNPEDPYYGLPPMTIAAQTIESDYYARDYNKRFFKNDASAGLMLSTDSNYDEVTDKRMKEQWLKNHRGYEKSHIMEILWAGLKPLPDLRKPRDIQYLGIIKLSREEIISLFGTPPAVVGLFEYANYANAMMQKTEFWQETLIPIMMHYETSMNEREIPKWTDEELWMKFDTSAVSALQEDENKKAERSAKLVGGGIYTPNEARAEFYNLEALEGGDELRTPQIGFGATPPEKGIVKSLNEINNGKWVKNDTFRRGMESRMYAVMKKYFKEQENRILLNLIQLDDEDTVNENQALFDKAKEEAELIKVAKPVFESAYVGAGQNSFDEIENPKSIKQDEPILATFDLTDPAVVLWLEEYGGTFVAHVTETTMSTISELVTQAYEEGITVQELGKRIAEQFSDFTKARSMTIARTEMGNCVNAGHYEGFNQAGATHKSWIATPDSRVRETHYEAGLQPAIPLNQAFRVGSSIMMYPNDPAGLPEDIINCRCSWTAERRE